MLALSLQHLIDLGKAVPERLAKVEDRLERILSIANDIRSGLIHNLALPPVEATFVYLLPSSGPMSCRPVYVKKGDTQSVGFTAYDVVPPGVWVIVAGPALVHSVRVGNVMQSSCMSDFHGHVCKTVDEWKPGVVLTVELQA